MKDLHRQRSSTRSESIVTFLNSYIFKLWQLLGNKTNRQYLLQVKKKDSRSETDNSLGILVNLGDLGKKDIFTVKSLILAQDER